MKKCLLCLALMMALLLGGCALNHGEAPVEHAFRYAENQSGDYPTTLAAEYFANRVAEYSQGRIRIYVYPDAALGDERAIIEQMQIGGIDFGRVNLSPLAEYDPRLFVLQLPYLYQDSAHMWEVLEGPIGARYLDALSEIDIIGLAWVDAGARNFYTREGSIASLEDLQGMRIRVQENTMMERLVALLGGVPVQMRYGDVLAALQTGKIDGAENNYPSYHSTGHYLVAPYMVEDGHSRIPEVIVASRAAMERLSEADRQLVLGAAQEAANYQRVLWQAYEAQRREDVIASGCVIETITEAQKRRLQEITRQMYAEFAGDDLDVVDAITALRE